MIKQFTILTIISILIISCFDTPSPSKAASAVVGLVGLEERVLSPFMEIFIKERKANGCEKISDKELFVIYQAAIPFLSIPNEENDTLIGRHTPQDFIDHIKSIIEICSIKLI